MSRWAWIDPRIAQVTVSGARAYLLDHGWRPRPFPRPEVLVFEGPISDEGRPFVQILPSSDKFVDYTNAYRGIDRRIGCHRKSFRW